MELTASATNTVTTVVKTPEAETEKPNRIQPTKSLSFSNGFLKRRQPLNHHHHHPTAGVTYKECLKNHAASLGSHALDGCGEFMPSPTSTSTDPTSLKCAACGCHRNFHRREPEESSALIPPPITTAALEYQPHRRHHPPPPPPPAQHNSGDHSSPSSPSPPPISSSYYPSAPRMLLTLSAGLSGPPPDINNNLPVVVTPVTVANTNGSGRKRYRTKFTQNQKDKMLEFADKVGWKIQKIDEELISNFCDETGVDKGVLKVWMHNNKYNFGKRDQSNNTTTVNGGATMAEAKNGNDINDYGIHYHNHPQNNEKKNNTEDQNHHLAHKNNNSDSIVVATNGSSSSS